MDDMRAAAEIFLFLNLNTWHPGTVYVTYYYVQIRNLAMFKWKHDICRLFGNSLNLTKPNPHCPDKPMFFWMETLQLYRLIPDVF